jgi:hypothetical protein
MTKYYTAKRKSGEVKGFSKGIGGMDAVRRPGDLRDKVGPRFGALTTYRTIVVFVPRLTSNSLFLILTLPIPLT